MGTERRPAVSAALEADIDAPPGLVWHILTNIRTWPNWHPDVNKVQVSGQPGPGTRFRWSAGGARINSRIEEFVPTDSLVWSGRTFGLRAVHAWQVSVTPTGVRVRTEEQMTGILARLFPRFVQRALRASLERALAALKLEAEWRMSFRC